MSGPSKHSSPYAGELEAVRMYVERLRQQAEAFQRAVEDERRTVSTLLEDLRVRQAKRRGRGRRLD